MTPAERAHHSSSEGRSGRLDRVLADLLAQAPHMQAAAVVSFDGLPMASMLPPGMDEDRVAAMSAALLSLGERAAMGLGRGELSQVYVEGDNGNVFLVSAEDEAVLVAVASREAKVGLMIFEAKRAAADVAAALRADDRDTAAPPTADPLGEGTPPARETTAVHVPAPASHPEGGGPLQGSGTAPTAPAPEPATLVSAESTWRPDPSLQGLDAVAAQDWTSAPNPWG